jgi:hypothetical protein
MQTTHNRIVRSDVYLITGVSITKFWIANRLDINVKTLFDTPIEYRHALAMLTATVFSIYIAVQQRRPYIYVMYGPSGKKRSY